MCVLLGTTRRNASYLSHSHRHVALSEEKERIAKASQDVGWPSDMSVGWVVHPESKRA